MSVRSYLPGTGRRVRVCAAAADRSLRAGARGGPAGTGSRRPRRRHPERPPAPVLHGIAADTWKFYAADVDPSTHLPLDNLGRRRPVRRRHVHVGGEHRRVPMGGRRGPRSGPDRPRAGRFADQATLDEVATLKRYDGFLYQWYDTNNGNVLLNPGQGDCGETTPAQDNCWFVSAVDNGWYASGLIEVREALPELRGLADRLLAPMNFAIFYDNRAQTDCNVNAALGNQHTGTMYGGYYV